MISYDKFIDIVNSAYKNNSFDMRHGQILMNVLYALHPECYNNIIGSDYDCFYNDRKVPETMKYLTKNWNVFCNQQINVEPEWNIPDDLSDKKMLGL